MPGPNLAMSVKLQGTFIGADSSVKHILILSSTMNTCSKWHTFSMQFLRFKIDLWWCVVFNLNRFCATGSSAKAFIWTIFMHLKRSISRRIFHTCHEPLLQDWLVRTVRSTALFHLWLAFQNISEFLLRCACFLVCRISGRFHPLKQILAAHSSMFYARNFSILFLSILSLKLGDARFNYLIGSNG